MSECASHRPLHLALELRIKSDSTLIVVGSTISGNETNGGRSETIFSEGDAILINSSVMENTGESAYLTGVIRGNHDLILVQTTVANDTSNSYFSHTAPLNAGRDIAIYSNTISGNLDTAYAYGYVYGADNTIETSLNFLPCSENSIGLSNSIMFGEFFSSADVAMHGTNIVDGTLFLQDGLQRPIDAQEVFANTTRLTVTDRTYNYEAGTSTFVERDFIRPVLAYDNGAVATAALQSLANNPALNSGVGAIPSEADLGVDINRDEVLSTDPINTDANGNLRIVGGAMDLGPVEVQNIKPARLKIVGDEGDNTLTDADGNDNFFGRGGSDTFVLIADGQADSIKDFEAGIDQIDVSTWGVADLDSFTTREHPSGKLILSNGDETLAIRWAAGPLATDDLTEESFIFSAPTDMPDPVLIEGTDGRDRLRGTDLGERIVDGADVDNLFGRGGADTFVLVADGANDSIKDFELGIDLIDLSAWGAVNFEDLSIRQKNDHKMIVRFQDETLSVQNGRDDFQLDLLTEDHFILV